MNRTEKKTLRQFIAKERYSGKTDQSIYDGLKANYNDKRAIAKLIAGTADPKTIIKYKWLAHLLVAIVVITFCFYCYMSWGLAPNNENSRMASILLRTVPFFVFTILFIYHIYQFEIDEQRLFLTGFFWGVLYNRLAKNYNTSESVIAISIFIIVIVLCAIYSKKMFPRYGFFGIKKGKDGEYIL